MNTIKNTTYEPMNMGAATVEAAVAQNKNAKVVSFVWHLAQMFLAMEAGMLAYDRLLSPLLAYTPFAALTAAYPSLGYWAMVISMTLPMIGLMKWYHRSTWGYTLGMVLAMIAPLAVLNVLGLFSLIPPLPLCRISDPVMMVAMAAYLLIHPQEREHTHAGHPHADPTQGEASATTTNEEQGDK